MQTPKQHHGLKPIAKRRRPPTQRDMERQRENHARETREWIYLFTILNYFWFTGDLPDHPAIPFILLVNPNWPLPYELPKHLEALGNLSESQLRFICKQLKTPNWTAKPDAGRSLMTLSDTLLWTGLDRPTDAFTQPNSI